MRQAPVSAAGMLACLLAGLLAGTISAAVWNALKLPARAAARSQSARPHGAALALGGTLGAYLSLDPLACLALPVSVTLACVALGGAFVGMTASGLTEAFEIVPLFKRRLGGFTMVCAACALAAGKLLGALCATLLHP